MNNSTKWFGWTVVILALHMSEQMIFGIGELAPLKRVLAVYYAWFQQPDYGTVALVTIIGTLINLLIFGILRGGLWREISVGVFGVISVCEVHHLMETANAVHYTPGSVTAIPYVAVGVLMLRALVHEHHAPGAATRRTRLAEIFCWISINRKALRRTNRVLGGARTHSARREIRGHHDQQESAKTYSRKRDVPARSLVSRAGHGSTRCLPPPRPRRAHDDGCALHVSRVH